MRKDSKRGITLVSLVVYVLLFTTFTVFVATTSSNMNERLFDSRGEAINYSSLNKLQYNLDDSARASHDVMVTGNTISYSNGDNYVYDNVKNVIYKNGGILCSNIQNLDISLENGINVSKVTLTVEFSKYLNVMTRTLVSCVEEF